MVKAAYLHIPFCEHICHYCDFNKVFLQGQPIEKYLSAMEKEIEYTMNGLQDDQIDSVFVGGGTPTALSMKETEILLEIIRRYFPIEKQNMEFTFEANPGDLPKEKLTLLKQGGVNRLSFGVQAFQDDLLKKLGRSHRSKDVFAAVEAAQSLGFHNLNIDLIYGLPEQQMEDFIETINIAMSLNVQHFSGYSLQVEPKTVFFNQLRKGKLLLPSEDVEAAMFIKLMEKMDSHGYQQYEISNFSFPGFESKHNLVYWDNEEYLGIGAGAHSYVNGYRNANVGTINKYINMIHDGKLPYRDQHFVTIEEKMEEQMFLGLRKMEGVSKQTFMQRFNKDLFEVFGKQIKSLVERGLLKETDKFLSLTNKGKLLGNEVFQEFIGV